MCVLRGICVSSLTNTGVPRLVSWLWSGKYGVVKAQLLVAFVVITLLNIGYYWERELTDLAARQNLQSVIKVWDGFEWYAWLAMVPAVVVLIHRFPLQRGRMVRSVAGLIAGSFVVYLLIVNVRYALRMLPDLWLPDEADLPLSWATYFHTQLVLTPIDFLTYSWLFATSFAVDYYFKYRRRAREALGLELRTAQLQADLAQAQLAALRGQLQPHFLFNAFNAVSSLVRQQKNEVAVEMIAQLSALLRFAMEDAGLHEITLKRELEFVMHYLAVERVRFGDKLRIDVAVPPDTLPALVPNLLLQPLVGNAIKHAISRRTTPGTVRIAARRTADRLVFEVVDDGPGETPAPPPANRTGVGLTNTRARLAAVYRDDYRFEMIPTAEGGMLVRLDLPWRTAPAPAQAPAILT